MRIIKNPIGCIAFTSDGHKTVIIRVQEETQNIKGHFIGKCVHGDTFEFPFDHPIFEQVKYTPQSKNIKEYNLTEAVAVACQQPTLLEALTFICIWESERAINQARFNYGSGSDGAGWDTCFGICLKNVIDKYPKEQNRDNEKISKILKLCNKT